MSGENASVGKERPRRRGWARALVVLASVLAFAAILAVWANRQVLNTDNWTNTSTELLENRVIRDQIAVYIVDELYANVDVTAELRAALPERLQPLAGPAAGGLRQLAERASKEALARPRAQQAWADANRNAQLALLTVLEGGGPVVSTEGGDVVLDLKALLGQMQERVGIGGRLQERLPDSAAQITIMRVGPARGGAERSEDPPRAADRPRGAVARALRPRARARAGLAARGAARVRDRLRARRRPRADRPGPGGAGARQRADEDRRRAARGPRGVDDLDDPARPGGVGDDRLRRVHGLRRVAGRAVAADGRGPARGRAVRAPSGRRLRGPRRVRRAAAVVGADARDPRPRPGADPRRAARDRHGGAAAQDRARASRCRHGRVDRAHARARRHGAPGSAQGTAGGRAAVARGVARRDRGEDEVLGRIVEGERSSGSSARRSRRRACSTSRSSRRRSG